MKNKIVTGVGMNINTHHLWISGLLMLALSACSSDSTLSNSTDIGSRSGNSASGDMNAPAAAPATAAMPATPATPQISYGTVQAIDPMARQEVGVGALGAAAVGGGMDAPTDKVYRVTVKMDDGGSQMVVVDTMPSYKTGDRVRYSNGMLQQY